MQNIEKIYDISSEEAFNHAVGCRIECNMQIKGMIPLYLQQYDALHPMFSFVMEENEVLVKLHLDTELDISPADIPSFKHLFWIIPDATNQQTGILHYIECGTVKPLPSIDIAIDDNTIVNLKQTNVESFKKHLKDNYVFDGGKYKFLVVKPFENGRLDWHVLGFRPGKDGDEILTAINVVEGENKEGEKIRLIKSYANNERIFPNNFSEIELLAYEDINFVDIGEAHEAHDAIIERIHQKDALTSLWKDYSRIELEDAREESERLGYLEYEFTSKPKDEIVHIVLKNINAEQCIMLKKYANEQTQFQLVVASDHAPIVSLLKFNIQTHEAEFHDELYRLPRTGRLMLSVIGNEIVDKRRKYALKELFKGNSIVLKNLLFAIEGEADKMLIGDHKYIKPTSAKTEKFLEEKFHIKGGVLTQNQTTAVEMALNNRNDVTIIQGPPGTGKTTVIAAICHRLLEEYKGKDASKAILASAFQNDTIEHLASKIYTHGLPTVKIGRKTLGIKAEEYYKADLSRHLQEEIDKRGGNCVTPLSKQIQSIADIYNKEGDVDSALEAISELMESNPDMEFPYDRLQEIKSSIKVFRRSQLRDKMLVESLPSSAEDYNSGNGFETTIDILESNINLTQEQKDILSKAPDSDCDEDYISELCNCKDDILRNIEQESMQTEARFHEEITSWISDAAKNVHHKEEMDYDNEDEFLRTILNDIKEELDNNTTYIRKSLQIYGKTIAATNQLAGSKAMEDFPSIQNVILEEAARSNPLDLIIPMVKAEDRIIMVGDQNQLPQLLDNRIADKSLQEVEDIDDKKAKRDLYEKSLFYVIFENLQKDNRRVRWITLQEQFRMHPTIGNFISRIYYNPDNNETGQLRSGTSELAETKLHRLSIPWAKNKTFVFCNVDGSHPESKLQTSKARKSEVVKLFDLLDEIKSDKEFKNLSVGIISFYSMQVHLLFEEAARRGYAMEDADGYKIHPDYKVFDGDKEKLRIGSVDSFQGKEFDIVILSTVRSNSEDRVEGNEKKVFGFLTLKNRLNVAFSRAKKLVVVVGDKNMYNDDFAKKHVSGLYEICHNIVNKEDYGCSI